MKIEIILSDDINEITNGMSCFDCKNWMLDDIKFCQTIQGVIIVDGKVAKFSYSPYSNDGDIFTDDGNIRSLIKHLIPLYIWMNRGTLVKNIFTAEDDAKARRKTDD